MKILCRPAKYRGDVVLTSRQRETYGKLCFPKGKVEFGKHIGYICEVTRRGKHADIVIPLQKVYVLYDTVFTHTWWELEEKLRSNNIPVNKDIVYHSGTAVDVVYYNVPENLI